MKILIIGFSKIKYMPYINLYLDNLNTKKNTVHIIYWNRDLNQEQVNKKYIYHEFKCFQQDDISKISKIYNFMKFRKFALKNIKTEKYDFIICLHTFPAFLLKKVLFKKYKNNYIFDYRDYTYEDYFFFKKRIHSIVNNSYLTFVSSDNYRNYLPHNCKYKIFTSHNILYNDLNSGFIKKYKKNSKVIRIAFWGFIREEELNKIIIEKISKDERFELHYYGREQKIAQNLIQFVQSKKISNVFFHGEYSAEDKVKIVNNTDIIHNIYVNKNAMICVGNKYYDGLIFKIPQLCMENSYMAQLSEKNGVGISCNPYDENFTNIIFNYYSKINVDKFDSNCEKVLVSIKKEYNTIAEKISKI